MGGDDATAGAADEPLPCCGHSWHLHTPECQYWYPGSKIDAPALCGCDGAGVPGEPKPAGDPQRSRAASAPAH